MSLALLLGSQLRAFRDAGYEVIGVSAPGPFVERIEREGIVHIPLADATRRAFEPRRDMQAMFALYRLFRRLRPDIAHTHNPKPGVYGRLAARLARVPLVVNTQHGLYAQSDDGLHRRLLVYSVERAAAAFSHVELVQSREDFMLLRKLGVPTSRLVHLGNGVDLDRFDRTRWCGERVRARTALGATDETVVVGAVGRLVREKGYFELFDAARQLAGQVLFVVVGAPDPEKGDSLTRHEIRRAQRAGVMFLGQRDDMERVYAAMDIYVLASYREGFPRSAMEASAMGLPVIAADVRGSREVVDHGVTGYLVPARDSNALAAAIGKVASDRDLREGMGLAAAAKARREFDEARVVAKTLAAYRRRGGTSGHRLLGARSRSCRRQVQ